MKNRLARLANIHNYLVEHPYSTCKDIAEFMNLRIKLVQADIRIMYRAGLLGRRKVDNSKSKLIGNAGKEYYALNPPRKLDA